MVNMCVVYITATCGKGWNSRYQVWRDNALSLMYKSEKAYTYRGDNFLKGEESALVFMCLVSHCSAAGRQGVCFVSFVIRACNAVSCPLQVDFNNVFRKEWGWSSRYREKNYAAYLIEDRRVHECSNRV